MLRVVFTIVVPLVLPTALYLLWLRFRPNAAAVGPEEDPGAALPWFWLAVSGAVLLALVLLTVSIHFGTATPGVYVPPRWQDGRVVPGHLEPLPNR